MLLAVDIGNSNVVFGLHKNGEWIKIWRLDTVARETINHHRMRFSQELIEAGIRLSSIHSIVMSSVVPDLTPKFSEFLREICPDRFILLDHHIYDKLQVRTSNPHEMGTDIMANAIAAHSLWQQDLLIIDFGTALTFTLVLADGTIEGVNIVPGLNTAIKALATNTAQLQDVMLELPGTVLGKTTIEAIQNGIMHGYTGLVAYMIDLVRSGYNPSCKTIATGGLAGKLPDVKFDRIDKELTLNGLKWINDHLNQ